MPSHAHTEHINLSEWCQVAGGGEFTRKVFMDKFYPKSERWERYNLEGQWGRLLQKWAEMLFGKMLGGRCSPGCPSILTSTHTFPPSQYCSPPTSMSSLTHTHTHTCTDAHTLMFPWTIIWGKTNSAKLTLTYLRHKLLPHPRSQYCFTSSRQMP